MATALPLNDQAARDRTSIDAFLRNLGAAAADVVTLPVRGVAGAVDTVMRLPNAYGANIPPMFDNPALTRSLTPYSDALSATRPAVTPPATADAGAGAGRGKVTPASANPDTPAPASAVARTPRPARAPAAAPAAPGLVPGETGFYVGDRLLPYGQTFTLRGDGTTSFDTPNSPVAAATSGLVDPRAYFRDLVQQQQDYAARALGNAMQAAGDPGSLGYSARLRAAAAMYGVPIAGQGIGGASAYNSALAGIINQGVQSATQLQTSQNALTGDLARADASVRSANIGARPYNEQMALRQYEFENTPRPAGSAIEYDPVTKTPIVVPTYALPPLRSAGPGGMPRPINPARPKAEPQEGATGKTPDGRSVVYKQGQWVAQ